MLGSLGQCHAEGVSPERGDQQDEHDEGHEDPQVTEEKQVDHVGLSEVFFLSGVGGADRRRIIDVNTVDAMGKEHTATQGNEHREPQKPGHQSCASPLQLEEEAVGEIGNLHEVEETEPGRKPEATIM
uniref:Uncharacterized protein n=1 Tax=Molossus molossus TaxID=27622 RepID=A0A7J8HC54_MOLMO|nr:hypothetical protein HJG59_011202 [Molossus molossus]